MNVAPSKKVQVFVVSEKEDVRDIFERSRVFFKTLAHASEVLVQPDKTGVGEDAVSVAVTDATVYMPLAELVDIEKEIERLEKEREKRLVDTLFLSLYERDAKSLRRDLAKLSVFGKAEAAPSQRIALLRCLFGVLASYVRDHFPETYAMVEDASGMEDDCPDLDIWG